MLKSSSTINNLQQAETIKWLSVSVFLSNLMCHLPLTEGTELGEVQRVAAVQVDSNVSLILSKNPGMHEYCYSSIAIGEYCCVVHDLAWQGG